ncbi:hypothetical protein ACTL6U_03700 [Rhodovibrionaceae bacterium A322]
MIPYFSSKPLTKTYRRLWFLMIAIVIGFGLYALYQWLWLGEPLKPHASVARALFITFLAVLLVGKLIWKNRKGGK